MSFIQKAEQSVTSATPTVFDALNRVKFLLITIPIICVGIGIAAQNITQEQNIGTVVFKMGTFATSANPEPVLLANETQVRARLRQYARDMYKHYPKSLLITSVVEKDVVRVTGFASGEFATEKYLADLVQKEIDFQNGRLEKLRKVQHERKKDIQQSLETQTRRLEEIARKLKVIDDPVSLLSLQQAQDNSYDRVAKIKKELAAHTLINSTDLFIDTTQIVQQPFIVASSNWYRPLIFGLIGLAVGLGLTLIIAIASIFSALTRKSREAANPENANNNETAFQNKSETDHTKS
jgi:hypothetical protein